MNVWKCTARFHLWLSRWQQSSLFQRWRKSWEWARVAHKAVTKSHVTQTEWSHSSVSTSAAAAASPWPTAGSFEEGTSGLKRARQEMRDVSFIPALERLIIQIVKGTSWFQSDIQYTLSETIHGFLHAQTHLPVQFIWIVYTTFATPASRYSKCIKKIC